MHHDAIRAPPLPIVWGDVTEKNVKQLQRLNQTIFPIRYDDKFYKHALNAPPGFVKLVYYNDVLIAAVCCRKEPYAPSPASDQKDDVVLAPDPGDTVPQCSLYILTLGVLAPYREHGVGTRLLAHVLDVVENSPSCADVVDVYLHVQEGNDDALRFYQSHGFKVAQHLVGYYRRIVPADCYVVRKAIERS